MSEPRTDHEMPTTDAGQRLARELRTLNLTDDPESWWPDQIIAAIEAEATAESGRLREALRELDVYLSIALDGVAGPVWYPRAKSAVLSARALLATPPAPSDHGALDVERLVNGIVAIIRQSIATVEAEAGDLPSGQASIAAREHCIALIESYAPLLATPSVPPEPASPEAT